MIRSQVRKTATAGVTVTSWDETLYDAPDGQPALAKAEFGLTYTGDLMGESSTGELAGLRPATPADVAGYLDARRADLMKLWPDDLEEVSVDERTAWLLSEAVAPRRASPAPLTRLLGPFDPYLQARDRDLIVPDRTVQKALWPILSRPGVLFVDGEVVGTWRPKSARTRLDITVEAFVPLPPPVRRAVRDEADRVATVRGAHDVTVIWSE
jgi:winged helix DNA-binding protein